MMVSYRDLELPTIEIPAIDKGSVEDAAPIKKTKTIPMIIFSLAMLAVVALSSDVSLSFSSDSSRRLESKPKPNPPNVTLAYVDVSGGHTAHPHRGATNENSVFGYVHDETELARNPPPFQLPDDNDEQHDRLCKKGDPNYEMLTKKVFVDLQGHEAAEKRAERGSSAMKKRAKIFCLVYTIEKFHDRIPTIRETWG